MKVPNTRRGRLLALAVGAGIACAVPSSAAAAGPAIGQVRLAGTPTAVPGSYIVVLKDGRTTVASTARSLASAHGATVGRVYSAALRGFEARMSEREAKRLAAEKSVAYVEQNQTVRVAETQDNPPSWGIDRIDQRNLPLDGSYTYPTTASTVHAYVIDTGIRFTHTTFGGRATSGFDFVDNDADATDCNGHGTHVSGTVGGDLYGVAKEVQLVGVRVLDCNGSGTLAGVVAGINWVTANAIQPAVANMSLGGGASAALDSAVTASINAGVTYAVAAGNENANACNTSPARTPAAITVGASTITDARASFSNIGTCVDIFAPGAGITSSYITSDTATATASGTSMASPHVAGAAALVLADNPSFTPAEVRDFLVENATTGVVTSPGTGSPDRLLFVVN